MTARAVHWHEGMFLQPHHFQAEHRYQNARTHRAIKWPVHHNWGLREISVDPEALANSRLVDGRLTYPILLQSLDPAVGMQFQMSSMTTREFRSGPANAAQPMNSSASAAPATMTARKRRSLTASATPSSTATQSAVVA